MARRALIIKGTSHKDGSYTVTAQGPKAMRRIALATFAQADKKREILTRTDRYIMFGPRR